MWAGPGLGKTLTALYALQIAAPRFPVLVITRAIGRHVWPRDAKRWLSLDWVPGVIWAGSARSVTGVHQDGTFTSLALALSEHNIVVTNYDVLKPRLKELLAVPWGALILDEAHSVKGGYQPVQKDREGIPHYTRYHFTKWIAEGVQKRRGPVWQLTATPVRDRRRDLWAQLDIALPGKVTNSWNWLHRYCLAKRNSWGGLDTSGEANTEELHAWLAKHYIRITREEVADQLPPKQRDVRVLDGTPLGTSQYLGGGVENAIARAAESKLGEALELIGDHLEAGDRVVLVTNRKRLTAWATVEARRFIDENLDRKTRETVQIASTTGDEPVKPRVAKLKWFNELEQPGLLVATGESLRESVDLHHCAACVVLSLPYSPGDIDQLEGRFGRLGGIPCTIYYLVASGTIDERIRELLLDKLGDVVALDADTTDASAVKSTLSLDEQDEATLADLSNWLNSHKGATR